MVIRGPRAGGPSGVNRDPDSDSGRVTRISDIRSTERAAKKACNPLAWEPVYMLLTSGIIWPEPDQAVEALDDRGDDAVAGQRAPSFLT